MARKPSARLPDAIMRRALVRSGECPELGKPRARWRAMLRARRRLNALELRRETGTTTGPIPYVVHWTTYASISFGEPERHGAA